MPFRRRAARSFGRTNKPSYPCPSCLQVMVRDFSYRVKTLGGEEVTLTGKQDHDLQPPRYTQPTLEKPRAEIQRILISQPMLATPTDAWLPPRPHLPGGERIQVTAHVTENSEIVERWQFSETDVRWYRLERYSTRWVSIKVERKVPIG